jgi:hypothetical protein
MSLLRRPPKSEEIARELTDHQKALIRDLATAGADGLELRQIDKRLSAGPRMGKLITGTLKTITPPRVKLSALGRAVALRL